MIRVAVVDDHPAPRVGIVQAVGRAPDIEVVGEASNVAEAWDLLAQNPIDVLLLDLHMPDFDPFHEVRKMRTRHPKVHILVVSAEDDEDMVHSMTELGIAGYLLKDEDLDKYIEAVREVAQGQPFFSKRILRAALNGGPVLPVLTRREKEVLELVARGDTSAQVGRALHITERTVNNHIENIFRKLEVNTRTAAATKAQELGLISVWKGK